MTTPHSTQKYAAETGGAGWFRIRCLALGLGGIALMNAFLPVRAVAASPLFIQSAGSPIATGNRPTGVATGDFNGDGKADFVVANSQFSQITVMLGDGNGGFAPATGSPFFAGGGNPSAIIAKDFNKDGKLDLAVLYLGTSTVRILLGDGHAGFTFAPAGPTTVGSPAGYMAAADFNGDSVPDIAFSADSPGAEVIVLISDGAGGFTTGTGSPFSTGFVNRPTGIVTGDFNKDGKTDIVCVSSLDSGLTVLLGDGASGFTPLGFNPSGSTSPGSAGISAIAAGDFLNRGTLDLMTAATNINEVNFLKGDGTGNFSYQRQLPDYQFPNSLIVADFDGDGNLDVAVTTGGTNYLTVYPGNGAGNFNTNTSPYFPTGQGPANMATADFDGDGRPDLVISNNGDNTLTVLLSNGPKLPLPPSTPPPAAITQVPQTISFSVANHLASDQPFALAATASSALPVSFSVLSGPATIAGNTLTLTGVGTVTVEAFQPGNYAFLPATSDQSFSVALGTPTITSVVNGASFVAGLVPNSYYATIFGNNLAAAPVYGDATSSQILGGATVTITDSAKRAVTTDVWFVSYGQANFVVPVDLASGAAMVTLTNNTGKSASFQITIGTIAPGLFSVDGTGAGLAMANVLIVGRDGSQTVQLAAADTPFGPIPVPIPMASGTQVYLILSGTGIRGRSSLAGVSLTIGGVSAPVVFAGSQGGYPALDQVDALIPASLAGAGTVKVALTVDGIATNALTLKFQ